MNIIMLSSNSWYSELFQRPHHFASLLSKKNKVLYVEPIRVGKNKKISKNLEIWFPDSKLIKHSSVLLKSQFVSTIIKTFFKQKYFKFREKKLKPQYLKKFQQFKGKNNIVIFTFPHFVGYIPFFKKNRFKIVYDVMDDYSHFRGITKKIKKQEIKLLKKADLVTTSSLFLLKRIKKIRKDAVYIPNAADSNVFKIKKSNKLKNIKKPVIGYHGAISDWFDTGLLKYLAKNRKNYSFVVVGPISRKNKNKLSRHKNIVCLGRKPYQDLPKYVSNFDIGIIPFKINSLTKSVNPVKIYEYLFLGKPVVSTNLPYIDKFQYTYASKTRLEFLKNIDKALKTKINIKKIKTFAKNNTWQKRVSILESKL